MNAMQRKFRNTIHNMVTTELIMQIGHWKEFLKLIFRALAPRQSEF